MHLDIRLPIGLMFGFLGLVLTIYGLATGGNAAVYQRSLGININLWWGLVCIAFAALMLGLAWRRKR